MTRSLWQNIIAHVNHLRIHAFDPDQASRGPVFGVGVGESVRIQSKLSSSLENDVEESYFFEDNVCHL